MKKKMNLVRMTLDNETKKFTRREVRNNFADMLRDTMELDDRLFLKFWKEFFPKVTLSLQQIDYLSNYYSYRFMQKVIGSMDGFHLEFKLTDDQKWYYGVYEDD